MCAALQRGSRNVSIHAPARGATVNLRVLPFNSASFNPRAREGRDRPGRARVRGLLCFNPRAREGRDGVSRGLFRRERGFQSTRPRGARHGDFYQAVAESLVSIHAPARGATS